MADECLAPFRQFHGKVEQLLEVVTAVGDFPRFKAEPSDHFKNGVEVDAFFRRGVGVIESAEIGSDRRKICKYFTAHLR